MHFETRARPDWKIDQQLKLLLGQNIRVRADAFTTPLWNGQPGHMIPAASLILPDNSTVHHDELFIEGKLLTFQRDVAIVSVVLERLAFDGETANGRVLLRGRQAVILQGPARVQLASDHFIEKLPTDFRFYWSHLGSSSPQFEFIFES